METLIVSVATNDKCYPIIVMMSEGNHVRLLGIMQLVALIVILKSTNDKHSHCVLVTGMHG